MRGGSQAASQVFPTTASWGPSNSQHLPQMCKWPSLLMVPDLTFWGAFGPPKLLLSGAETGCPTASCLHCRFMREIKNCSVLGHKIGVVCYVAMITGIALSRYVPPSLHGTTNLWATSCLLRKEWKSTLFRLLCYLPRRAEGHPTGYTTAVSHLLSLCPHTPDSATTLL